MPDSQKGLLPFLIISLGMIGAALSIGFSYIHAHPIEPKSMNVTGSAERLVDSDTVKWSLTLSQTVSPTDRAEAGRQLDKDRTAFLAYLNAAGVDRSSVSIQPMSISDDYTTIDFKTGQTGLTSYTAKQSLIIESSNVNVVGSLAERATVEMAEKGINLSTDAVEYYFNKLADVKLQLLTDATKNARARGEAILAGGGGSLGGVVSADTGVFQVTAVNSADLSDYGMYDTTSPRKKVTAVVHASFVLNQ